MDQSETQINVRRAAPDDVTVIAGFDRRVTQNPERLQQLRAAIAQNLCYVAEYKNTNLGYGILEYSFFGNGFISLVFVSPEHRRAGIGAALMQQMEQACRTPKVFTSTNLSNLPMQTLLMKLNYILSGVIYHLDEGDPEIIYYKYIGS